jgi:hypothetical protein
MYIVPSNMLVVNNVLEVVIQKNWKLQQGPSSLSIVVLWNGFEWKSLK